MIYKKLFNRFRSILKYRLINPLIKLSCKKNSPFFIYKYIFFIENKQKNKIFLELKKSFVCLSETVDHITVNWSFPSIYRSRSRAHYQYGLKARGYDLAISYNLNQIDLDENDVVIDCGANYGDLWLYFRFLEKSITYLAIEPGKEESKTLTRNIRDLNNSAIDSRIYEFALGNENKETKFYYSPEDADSSIIKPNNFFSTYIVKVKTLDSFLSEQSMNKQKIKLLKLEAEGFEPEIIYGAKNSIRNIKYISADLGPERGVKEDNTFPEVINFLLENGFRIKAFNIKRFTVLFINSKFDKNKF